MRIIDLEEKYEKTWLNCLEDWSDEMKDAGQRKSQWYEEYKSKGFRVKLAIDNDQTVGMIQYIPIENSYVEGNRLFFIYCIWVHGHKEGIGNQQHRGIGRALLEAAEDDAHTRGADGMAAWGLALPIWMKSSWYRKLGYKVADRDGIAHLLWKPFSNTAEKPKWIKLQKKPDNPKDKIIITAFSNGWCQVQNINKERARKVAAKYPEVTEFRVIDTTDRATLTEWGISDGVFLDNKLITTGPPLSEERMERLLNKRIRKKKL